jgi:hypothetical protein
MQYACDKFRVDEVLNHVKILAKNARNYQSQNRQEINYI